MLDTVQIDPIGTPQLSVIWMHGLGADGHDFESVVPLLGIPSEYRIRFVFPHAPHRSVTINMGMRMRAWYDILNPVLGSPVEDVEGINESCDQVSELIRHENEQGICTDRIVLAGFSQGGAIALYLGLRYAEELAGIMALSTYLPKIDATQTEASAANKDTPILYLHGSLDPLIAVGTAERSRRVLSDLGYRVQSKNYPIPHSVSPEEIDDIGIWLTERCKSRKVIALPHED